MEDRIVKLEKEMHSLTRANQMLQRQNEVTQATFLSIARMLNIRPRDFAEAMVYVNRNAEYEAEVLQEFQKITGRVADNGAVSGAIYQEQQKNK